MSWKLPFYLARVYLFITFVNLQHGYQTDMAQSSDLPSSTISEDGEKNEPIYTIRHCRDYPSPVVDCRSTELDAFPSWEGEKIKKSVATVELYLNFNKISKVEQIRNSSEITKIYFNRNLITVIDPFAFVNLPNLKTLDLSHNHLQTIDPDAFRSKFGSPLPLEFLNLSYNSITRLPEKVFDDLKNLKHLSLVRNKISHLPNSGLISLNSLVSLKNLNLSRNDLSDLPTDLKTTVARLHSLDVSGNKLKNIPVVLQHGKDIRTLIVSENNRTLMLDNQSFIGLKNVRTLEINKMFNLTVIHQGTFTHLKSLEYLHCSRNPKLHTIEKNAFANTFGGHANLKRVDFSNNSLSSLEVDVFKNMTLCVIDLRGNTLKCLCDIIELIQDNILIEQTCRFYPETGDGNNFLEMNVTDIDAFCVLEKTASRDLFWATIGILICFLMICLAVFLTRQCCLKKSQKEEIIPMQFQVIRQYTEDVTGKICTEYTKSP